MMQTCIWPSYPNTLHSSLCVSHVLAQGPAVLDYVSSLPESELLTVQGAGSLIGSLGLID